MRKLRIITLSAAAMLVGSPTWAISTEPGPRGPIEVAQTKDAGDAGAANKNDPAHSGGQSSGPASGTNVKPSQGPATGGNPGQPGLPGNKSGPPARPSGSDSPRR